MRDEEVDAEIPLCSKARGAPNKWARSSGSVRGARTPCWSAERGAPRGARGSLRGTPDTRWLSTRVNWPTPGSTRFFITSVASAVAFRTQTWPCSSASCPRSAARAQRVAHVSTRGTKRRQASACGHAGGDAAGAGTILTTPQPDAAVFPLRVGDGRHCLPSSAPRLSARPLCGSDQWVPGVVFEGVLGTWKPAPR